MRYLVMALIVALVVAGLREGDSIASAQSGCASQGAVSPDNAALVADCETLLSARDSLAGNARLNWSASAPIGDWEGITIDGAPPRVVGIFLGNRRLTGTIPSELGNLSNLEWMDLSWNELSGQIPAQMGNLSNLISLNLSLNELSESIPAQMGNLSNLIWMDLSWNELSESIPAQMGSLSNLILLHLDGNRLSGSIPTQMGNLSSLTVLDLRWNELSGQIPTALGDLSNLTWLRLSGNQLTGCIPDELRDVIDNDFDRLGLPFCAQQSLPGPPDVSMAVADTPMVRIASPVQVTAFFSEPVFGFTVDDVSVANGSVSNFVGSDGDSAYTFDVTPNAIGAVTVDIAAGVATDSDGNGNTAAVQLSLGIPYDDDGNGEIGRDEVITAIGDYLFNGTLIRDHVIALIGLYLFG